MKYFFTADEHYGHKNIIKYCDRPFKDVDEMDNEIIKRHNQVVGINDIVFHLGDFTLKKNLEEVNRYIKRLNGTHIFIRGSHDYWMEEVESTNEKIEYHEIIEKEIEGYHIVMCHYSMKVWARSHFNSWNLYGHSHGKLKGVGKQMDIGVDTNNFYPYSFEEILEIMDKKEDNFNKLKDSELRK